MSSEQDCEHQSSIDAQSTVTNSKRESMVLSAMDTSLTMRQQVGQALGFISNTINQNIITARYATIFSITALTVWGVSTSPLFFRFRRIADIPLAYFQQRKRAACRMVHIATIPKSLSKSGTMI
jgi:hypothetical protein